MNEFIHRGDNKKKFVQKMFDDISGKYDFLNHVLSLGIDLYWRRILVKRLKLTDNLNILDVATGTGDVGFAILKHHDVNIVGLDYSFNMVQHAQNKAKNKGCLDKFKFVQGDGENLPFADNQFDALTISYGFRNIGHFEQAMAEFYRILKPGGICAILEFQEPPIKFIKIFYQFYFKHVLPRIGAFFARSDAYRYLPESVQNFLDRNQMVELMKSKGFTNPQFEDLTFGVTSLFTAKK
jgi:demethylmenaquinone methyltransferase / 2-methoxy-6-polyprenyl-1,4-benzoquinol methylase